jgi:glycosyltransferase involved in cell wall biosynthesis
MRILVPLDNTGGGGIARVGTELAQALAQRIGPDDRLLVLGGNCAQVPRPGRARLADTYRPTGRITSTLHDQLSVIGPARHADIVHSIDAKAPRLTTTPVSITVHDVVFLDHPDWFPRSVVAYKRAVLAASLRRGPKLVVCVSHHTLARLCVHHPGVVDRSRVAVIHSGIPAGGASEPREVAPRDYFLTVSAIEPRKNHLGLLEAFQRARRAGLRLEWKIVGRPQYDAAAILEALTAAEGVQLVGRVDDQDLERLYDGARFVATPSWEEGFGLPPLEAMRRGVPVITSTGSALDETVGDGGLRIDPLDTEAWADALLALESDDVEAQRLSQAGLKQASRFRWDDAADAYLREFRGIARTCGGG